MERAVSHHSASESIALRVCNRSDRDGTGCSSWGEARRTSPIRLMYPTERDSRSEEEAEKDCRLRRESDEKRDIVADECDEDTAHIFLRRTPMELVPVSAARTVPIPCRGKGQRASRHQSLSCNVSAIRTPDCTLAARVRNGERHCRRGRSGERCRDEWRIESDVVVEGRRRRTLYSGERNKERRSCGKKKSIHVVEENQLRREGSTSRRIVDAREKRTAKRIEEPPRRENVRER